MNFNKTWVEHRVERVIKAIEVIADSLQRLAGTAEKNREDKDH